MVFTSLEYVVFLFAVFAAFWGLARLRLLRTVLLLVASYVFYMSWNAVFIVLIVVSTVVDYVVGLALGRTEAPVKRKALVATSVIINLGLLGTFKYTDFAISAVASGLDLLGVTVEPTYLGLVLPVGISFYTFQSLSYTIDVYRRHIEPTRSFLEFATFVSFFPQLVAGPIVRAREFLPQFTSRPGLDLTQAGEGMFLILVGMTKKVVVADFLALNLVDRVFDNPGAFSSTEVILAVYAYNWQIYADFSGYTDIARGSAKLFGFNLPDNFDRPYAATGPIEFWRRWHMTLSRWVQDYVYIPMGGSRHGRLRTYLNLMAAFIIIGIWHGAGWTYVLFGLWNAIGVTVNRIFRDLVGAKGPPKSKWWRVPLVVAHVVYFTIHWPVFRSPTVERMLEVWGQMFAGQWLPIRIGPWVLLVIIVTAAGHYTPRHWATRIERWFVGLGAPQQACVVAAVVCALIYVGGRQPVPFIYFQF